MRNSWGRPSTAAAHSTHRAVTPRKRKPGSPDVTGRTVPPPHGVGNASPMRFSAVGLRQLGIRVARMAWSSRLLQTALVLVVISVFLTLAQVWAQQRPVMASSLTQPQAPAYSTWQASAETNETTSCDTSTGTSPAPGTQWSKAWRFDSGTDPSATLSSPRDPPMRELPRCGVP